MGGTGSKAVKKIVSVFSNPQADNNNVEGSFYQLRDGNIVLPLGFSPFVYTRRGSMYIDEDGDVAHEFYEEVPIGGCEGQKTAMRRITANLRPQGEVPHEFPRINADFPVIICEKVAYRCTE